jgi:hypothetical protein
MFDLVGLLITRVWWTWDAADPSGHSQIFADLRGAPLNRANARIDPPS